MRYRFLGLFSALAIVWLAACKHKDDFTIQGELGHAGQIKKIYLLAADSTGVQVIDSTNLSEKSAFQFRAVSAYPNLFKLRIGGTLFDMIAQNGNAIVFKTDLMDTGRTSSISGSPASLELQAGTG